MPIPITTPYGYLVVIGGWRFSFVKKGNRDAFELGCSSGPESTDYERLWSHKHAKRAMLAAGHTVVV